MGSIVCEVYIHFYFSISLSVFVIPVNYLPNVLWGNLIQMCVEEPFMDILNIVCWNLELEMIFAWMVEVPGTGPCQAVGGQSAGDPGPLPPPPPPPRHHCNLPSLAIVRNGGRARQDMQITAHKVYIIVMISLSQTRASSCNVTSVNTVNSGQPASSVMQVISARTE